MLLKLNGKPFPEEATVAQRIISTLNAKPKDEVFTTDVLAQTVGIHSATLMQKGSTNSQLARFTAKIGRARYWGNPAAIQELRKQMEGTA
jgi:hypothetical protein